MVTWDRVGGASFTLDQPIKNMPSAPALKQFTSDRCYWTVTLVPQVYTCDKGDDSQRTNEKERKIERKTLDKEREREKVKMSGRNSRVEKKERQKERKDYREVGEEMNKQKEKLIKEEERKIDHLHGEQIPVKADAQGRRDEMTVVIGCSNII